MTSPDHRAADAKRLAGIRARLDAAAVREFQMVSESGQMAVASFGTDGSLVTIAHFEAAATQDEMELFSRAPQDTRFLLALVDRAARRIRELDPPPAPEAARGGERGERGSGKDYAAEAAIKCGEPAFRRFLAERHGLEPPLDADRAAQRLRSVLRVDSRARLNDDAEAAERWRALRGDFENWRRTG